MELRNGLVKLLDLRIQDLREAEQDGSGDLALQDHLDEVHHLHTHERVAGGVNGQRPLLADAENPAPQLCTP